MLVRMPFIIYDNVYLLLYQNGFGVLPTEISLLEGYINRSYQDPDWYDLFIISFFWGILLISFLAIRDRALSCTLLGNNLFRIFLSLPSGHCFSSL